MANESGNGNPRVNGSATLGVRDSMARTGKAGLVCMLAADDAAMERTAPVSEGSNVRLKVEM
jgi:hypothetical protein